MTVQADDALKEYPGNGAAVLFDGPRLFDADTLTVSLVDDATGAVTSPSYTLTNVGVNGPSLVTMDVAPPVGFTLLLRRTIPYAQTSDFTNQQTLLRSVVESTFDVVVMMIQQLVDRANRALRFGDNVVGFSSEITDLTPLGVLQVKADGSGISAGSLDGSGDLLLRADLADSTGADLVTMTLPGAGAVARSLADIASDHANVKGYGAAGDGIALQANVTIASGTGGLTVAGANFQTSDIGKAIAVRGAGVAGATLYALITARASTTQVTLSANASTSLVASSQRVVYGTVDDAAFQKAVDSLPAVGGTIEVPDAIYMIHAAGPNSGTKSIQWNIGAGTVFDGAFGGSTNLLAFPRANTNESIVPFGVFSQVRTSSTPQGSSTLASTAGLFEALQPTSHLGNAVGLYAGARSASAGGFLWAANILAQADAGFTATMHGIELDVNVFTADAGALIKGLGISGIGTRNPDVGIEIQHLMQWKRGIDILNSVIGLQIRTTVDTALSIYNPPASGAGSVLNGKQLANGNQTIALERATDTGPTGNFLRFRSVAGVDQFAVDVAGNTNTLGIVTAAGFTTTGTTDTFNMALRFAAPTVAAGVVGLGNGTGTTVGAAGGASALPATPAGYWTINVAGTNRKVPYYPV